MKWTLFSWADPTTHPPHYVNVVWAYQEIGRTHLPPEMAIGNFGDFISDSSNMMIDTPGAYHTKEDENIIFYWMPLDNPFRPKEPVAQPMKGTEVDREHLVALALFGVFDVEQTQSILSNIKFK